MKIAEGVELIYIWTTGAPTLTSNCALSMILHINYVFQYIQLMPKKMAIHKKRNDNICNDSVT